MAAVVANGPVSVSLSKGFFLIPLSELDIDDKGVVTAGRWDVPLDTGDQNRVEGRLKALAESGVLRKRDEPAPVPAMIITAAQAGAAGNHIEVAFANVDADAAPPTVDTTVSETDTYELLTPNTVEQKLGGAPGAGTSPGLVFVTDIDPTKLPAKKTYSLAIANPGDPAEAKVTTTGGAAAFTVKASNPAAEGAEIDVEIKDVKPGPKTFTLVATWQKAKTAVPLDTVAALNTEFGYLIDVQPPTGATAPLPPAAGKIFLHGGASAQPARPATATIVSGG